MIGVREPFYSALMNFTEGVFFIDEFILEIKQVCALNGEEIIVSDKELRHMVHNQLARLLNRGLLIFCSHKWKRNALYQKVDDFNEHVELLTGNAVVKDCTEKKHIEYSKGQLSKELQEVMENAASLEKRKLQLHGQTEGYRLAGSLLPDIKDLLEQKIELVSTEAEKINGVLLALNDAIDTAKNQNLAP
ncbi:hypothetical protein [Vibrio salinus]|uniref:hypothetical protein n=1 Tax=Vibrio salinus TaxID=2899784 RepID=UPI001E39D29F|nr:hypothetical protein [Vibrio salinus]MCE0494661.1 hypothetical protein [Vibrio salinus]